jgi:hypothetical protein
MNVFSNNIPQGFCCETNLKHIKNKEYLMWLQKMYENCIENEKDETKVNIMLEMRDAIVMKINQINREERLAAAF